MSSDHSHDHHDVYGVAQEHHRHYDLEERIEDAGSREISADKVYVSLSTDGPYGYLPEVIQGLHERIVALEAALAEKTETQS